MPDINMSPMVDMIFLLLIFFMVTAVFTKDAGLGINRPQAQTAQPLPQEAMILTVSENGEISHAADKNAPTGLTVQLIDQCRLGGVTDISIAATQDTP